MRLIFAFLAAYFLSSCTHFGSSEAPQPCETYAKNTVAAMKRDGYKLAGIQAYPVPPLSTPIQFVVFAHKDKTHGSVVLLLPKALENLTDKVQEKKFVADGECTAEGEIFLLFKHQFTVNAPKGIES